MITPIADDILMAATATPAEADALLRWLFPALSEWPRPAWHVWLVDATDRANPKVALIDRNGKPKEWQNVDLADFVDDEGHCEIFAGRAGLVVLAPHGIVREAEHTLYGIAAEMLRIRPESPSTTPYREFFASFGVSAMH